MEESIFESIQRALIAADAALLAARDSVLSSSAPDGPSAATTANGDDVQQQPTSTRSVTPPLATIAVDALPHPQIGAVSPPLAAIDCDTSLPQQHSGAFSAPPPVPSFVNKSLPQERPTGALTDTITVEDEHAASSCAASVVSSAAASCEPPQPTSSRSSWGGSYNQMALQRRLLHWEPGRRRTISGASTPAVARPSVNTQFNRELLLPRPSSASNTPPAASTGRGSESPLTASARTAMDTHDDADAVHGRRSSTSSAQQSHSEFSISTANYHAAEDDALSSASIRAIDTADPTSCDRRDNGGGIQIDAIGFAAAHQPTSFSSEQNPLPDVARCAHPSLRLSDSAGGGGSPTMGEEVGPLSPHVVVAAHEPSQGAAGRSMASNGTPTSSLTAASSNVVLGFTHAATEHQRANFVSHPFQSRPDQSHQSYASINTLHGAAAAATSSTAVSSQDDGLALDLRVVRRSDGGVFVRVLGSEFESLLGQLQAFRAFGAGAGVTPEVASSPVFEHLDLLEQLLSSGSDSLPQSAASVEVPFKLYLRAVASVQHAAAHQQRTAAQRAADAAVTVAWSTRPLHAPIAAAAAAAAAAAVAAIDVVIETALTDGEAVVHHQHTDSSATTGSDGVEPSDRALIDALSVTRAAVSPQAPSSAASLSAARTRRSLSGAAAASALRHEHHRHRARQRHTYVHADALLTADTTAVHKRTTSSSFSSASADMQPTTHAESYDRPQRYLSRGKAGFSNGASRPFSSASPSFKAHTPTSRMQQQQQQPPVTALYPRLPAPTPTPSSTAPPSPEAARAVLPSAVPTPLVYQAAVAAHRAYTATSCETAVAPLALYTTPSVTANSDRNGGGISAATAVGRPNASAANASKPVPLQQQKSPQQQPSHSSLGRVSARQLIARGLHHDTYSKRSTQRAPALTAVASARTGSVGSNQRSAQPSPVTSLAADKTTAAATDKTATGDAQEPPGGNGIHVGKSPARRREHFEDHNATVTGVAMEAAPEVGRRISKFKTAVLLPASPAPVMPS